MGVSTQDQEGEEGLQLANCTHCIHTICSSGKKVLGGSASWTVTGNGVANIQPSYPASDTDWTGKGTINGTQQSGGTATVVVTAVCASVAF